MRTLLIFMLAVWIYAATATAQIAAPRLDPNTLETFGPLNPATMSFSGSSRVGIGLLDIVFDATTGGVTSTFAEGEGKFLGFGRFVGETFSIGAESITFDITIPDGSGDTAESNSTYVGASLVFGDFISIGVGQQDSEFITRVAGGIASHTEEESLPLVGVSLKFGEAFYLGLAAGTGTFTDTLVFLGTTTIDGGDRSVTRLGAAYHFRDDDSGLHLELSREAKDGINNTATGFTVDEKETTTILLEAVFSNILVGVEKISGEATNPSTGVVSTETDGTTFTLGWVPVEGFSISISVGTEDETDPSTGDVFTTEITFVGASWLF